MDNVASVSATNMNIAVIKTDNSLWAWGSNDYGQLGDHTTEDRHTPVKIMDNVVAVSVGGNHTAAAMHSTAAADLKNSIMTVPNWDGIRLR